MTREEQEDQDRQAYFEQLLKEEELRYAEEEYRRELNEKEFINFTNNYTNNQKP